MKKQQTTIAGPTGPISLPGFNDRAGITDVILPTLGKLYLKNDGSQVFPSGSVRISPMTVAEEKMLAQKNSDSSRKVVTLLNRVADFHGMDPTNLLVVDQFYLLMKVRALSYGSNYTFGYRCGECSHQFSHTINIETELTVDVVDEDWAEPFDVHLPVSNKSIAFRLPRVFDEIELNKRKISRKDASSDPTFVAILARCIASVDGEAFTNPRMAEGWLDKQAVRDREALTEALDAATPGYNTQIDITCPSCGYIHEEVLPMGADFFRSDVSR